MIAHLPLARVRLALLCGLIIALVPSCGGERPSAYPTPTPIVGALSPAAGLSGSASQVEPGRVVDNGVAELVDRIRGWGIRIDQADASMAVDDPFLLTSGAAYATQTATLFIFPYADQAEAQAAAEQVPPDADDSHLRWAEDVDYFLCGRVIVLQYGPDGRAGHALRDLCGPPFASGKSRS